MKANKNNEECFFSGPRLFFDFLSHSLCSIQGHNKGKRKILEMSNCFVYGTLMAEEVLKCLIKRVPEQRPGKRAPIEGG